MKPLSAEDSIPLLPLYKTEYRN